MLDNSSLWIESADELLQKERPASASESLHFATSMLAALYGPESPQLEQFRIGQAAITKNVNGSTMEYFLWEHAIGAIGNAKAELKAGLIVNLRVVVAGEVLAEMIRLAKEILVERTEEAKNSASVLVAAAYEGLMRKMGEEFAGITSRPKLEEVIAKLKTAQVLKGGQVGTAQSYLKFRNDSLHADWKNVDRSQVESCLSFVESLLVKHFS